MKQVCQVWVLACRCYATGLLPQAHQEARTGPLGVGHRFTAQGEPAHAQKGADAAGKGQLAGEKVSNVPGFCLGCG